MEGRGPIEIGEWADADVLGGGGEADAPSMRQYRTDVQSELDADLEGGADRDSESFVGRELWY